MVAKPWPQVHYDDDGGGAGGYHDGDHGDDHGDGDAGGYDCDGAIFDLLIQSGDVVWRVDGQLVGVEGGDVEDVEECFLCGDQSTCISQKQV